MTETEVPESNLIRHAAREMDILGFPGPDIAIVEDGNLEDLDAKWNQMIRESIMEMVIKFAGQGHSGGSASQMLYMLQKLLNFEPLSPLTSKIDEWQEVGLAHGGQEPVWQNRRHSAAFSNDSGLTYYILDEQYKYFSKLPRWLRKKLHGTRLQYPIHMSKRDY